MVHVLAILLVTNAVSLAEKFAGHALRTPVALGDTHYQAIGLTLWQGDLAYAALLGLVVLAAAQTYRFVEAPWRDHARRLADRVAVERIDARTAPAQTRR